MISTQTASRREPRDPDLRYQMWILKRMLTREEWSRQRIAAKRLAYRPIISLVTPVYNTPPDVLRRMLDSVRNQTYPFWQHCLVDDASPEPWIAPFLERYAAADDRVVFRRRVENGGIVAGSNDAFALVTGEFVAMLDHDDKLAPQALYSVARLLNEHPEADFIYADFDVIWPDGTRKQPYWKPGWSPDRLRAVNYISHFSVYRRELVSAVGAFRAGLDGSQDHDLALRVAERTDRVFHIPDVLYHWAMGPTSVANNPAAKPYAYVAARRALVDHLARQGIVGTVEDGSFMGTFRVRYCISGCPLVSLVMLATPRESGPPDQALERFRASLASIVRETEYRPYEVVAIAPTVLRREVERVLAAAPDLDGRVVSYDGPPDYGRAMNAGAAASRGEYLVFLGEHLEVVTSDWLRSLLEQAQRRPIGAIGPKIYSRDDLLEHAAIIIPNGVPREIHRGLPRANGGALGTLLLPGNCSAVSGACLITRRAVFDGLVGFNAAAVVGYSDVDYCLRLRDHGYRILFTPYAELRQIGPPTSSHHLDSEAFGRFTERWPSLDPIDPYYNANLDAERADFTLKLD
jgi:O-antigen biosynthesis protein